MCIRGMRECVRVHERVCVVTCGGGREAFCG